MKHLKHLLGMTFSRAIFRRIPGISSLLLFLSAFIFNGCLSRPPIKAQTFAFTEPPSTTADTPANSGVLGIKSLQVSPPFDGRSFVYRTGEFSYERDPYAQFLGLPTDVLVVPVTELLRNDGGFGAVVKMGGSTRPDTLIEINIDEMYGDIRRTDSPFAVLSMQVILTEAKGGLPGKVLLQKNYSRQIQMQSTAPAALMAAWNEALAQIFKDIASDFRRRGPGA